MPKGDFKDGGKAPAPGGPRSVGSRGAGAYFAFMLVSTAFRSYESGIISSQMPAIRSELHLTYTSQGFVAAASDYGLLPSGLLAIVLLTRFAPYDVLRTAYFLIAGLTLLCVFRPTFGIFVSSRALGALLKGLSEVHYPAWVNAHGSREGKTMQLAVLSTVMVVGIFVGYLAGGVARSFGGLRWTYLYGIEAVLMGVCAVVTCFFDRTLVEASIAEGDDHGCAEVVASEQGNKDAHERTPLRRRSLPPQGGGGILPQELRALLTCPLYVFSVAISSTISGVIGFILYFVTQVAQNVMGWSPAHITLVVGVVFIVGPVCGNLGGAWMLSNAGGFENYVPAFRLVLIWVFLAWLFSALLPIAIVTRNPVLFIAGIFGLLLFGAAPVAAITGAAVNAVPGKSGGTYGSGVQFFFQHCVKMLGPIIGGPIIDAVGLGPGFCVVVMAHGLALNLFALGAYWAARNHHRDPPAFRSAD